MTDAKNFITLLKRTTKSKYKQLVMCNRMIMQCYNIDVDSDVGLHYVLPIPDTEEYTDTFYDNTLYLDVPKILAAYSEHHKFAEVYRKTQKLKPKDLVEEVYFTEGCLGFTYRIGDEYYGSTTLQTIVPDDMHPDVMNITKHYNMLLQRIKTGGICMDIDGTKLGLQEKASNASEIYFYTMKYMDQTIRVPLYKSMFLGIRELDDFHFTVQETMISKDIFICTFRLRKSGIEEVFWGYIVNY